MSDLLSPKQLEYIINATRRWNLSHGSVRTGKTIANIFAFLHAVDRCPDQQIFMIGHTVSTIYRNAVRLILESPIFAMHRPFCTWYSAKNRLIYRGKEIQILGATNEGSIGTIQGATFSVVYCDEMQLYPHSIIEMISTRLSNPHSIGFASMNPTFPSHPLKQWINLAESGDKSFYSMHFTLDDNPFLTQEYKDDLKKTLTGVFYKRNYLGLWCQAEGAIFDFFDEDIHVLEKPPRAAEYWIAGIDFGASNPTACLLIGVSSGRNEHADPLMWVEKEYYWNNKKQRPKLVGEFADDIKEFLEPYAVKNIYIDPASEVLQQELTRRKMHCVHAKNKVDQGIIATTSKMQRGGLYILKECKNTIREIQQYVWDPKAAKQGYDEPLKEEDHCMDALRYCIASHKISTFDQDEYNRKIEQQWRRDNWPGNNFGGSRF